MKAIRNLNNLDYLMKQSSQVETMCVRFLLSMCIT